MAATLRELLNAYANKVFDVEVTEGNELVLGGTVVSDEQAEGLLKMFGWTGHKAPIYDTYKFTKQLVKGIKALKLDDAVIDRVTVEFLNKPTSGFNKTFDRVEIKCNRDFDKVIICNMTGSPAKYAVYKKDCALVDSKERTLNGAIRSIFADYID